jgi:hypothetical protein
MNYDVRIDDNFLKADHSDGEVLQHTDLNELERVVKAGINANYLDIQKLQDGSLSVSNATNLKGQEGSATLSQSVVEILQSSDNKIPSSLQVKNFVESSINTFKTGLIFYWNSEGGQEGANIFNQVCAKYDAGESFIFYGKVLVEEMSYTDDTSKNKYLVVPIMVNKSSSADATNVDNYSFSIPPIYCNEVDHYVLSTIQLTGVWGNYTDVSCVTDNYNLPPATMSDLLYQMTSAYNETLTGDYSSVITTNVMSFTTEDAETLRQLTLDATIGNLCKIKVSINGIVNLIGEVVTHIHHKNIYSVTIDCVALGANSPISRATINIVFKPSEDDPEVWLNDTELTKISVSTL